MSSVRPPAVRTPAFSRRTALAGGATAAAATLTGCSALGARSANGGPTIPASDGKVTLTYWAWLKDLQKVCDVYNRTQDRIHVDAVWIPGGDSGGYAKELSAVAAGGGPDIAQIELRAIPDFAIAGALVDLSRYGADDKESLYAPSAWALGKIGDQVLGIPQDTGPGVHFYNRELLEEIGAQPPATWAEYRDLAAAVKDSGPNRTISTLNPADGSFITFVMPQAGAVWFRPQEGGWLVNLTDDASLTVAEYWDSMMSEGLVSTAYGAFSAPWYAAAGAGNILGNVTGSWGDALIEGSIASGSGTWAVADMPRWPDEGYGSGMQGGSSAAVMANSQHPVESLEFLTWMTTDPAGIDAMIQFSGIGWSPAKDYIGAQREKPSEYFSGQNYNVDVVQPMSEQQNLEWTWPPVTQRLQNLLADRLRTSATGGTKLADALPDLQKEVISIMRDIGLDVEEG